MYRLKMARIYVKSFKKNRVLNGIFKMSDNLLSWYEKRQTGLSFLDRIFF